jgi:hypothetical protein
MISFLILILKQGNSLVMRCNDTFQSDQNDDLFKKWKSSIDKQIIDRSELLWVEPGRPLPSQTSTVSFKNQKSTTKSDVLIVDLGTCSVRAGVYSEIPQMPELFFPTVCAKETTSTTPTPTYRVGFEAFDSMLASCAPSTIDLRKTNSMWSLNSTMAPLTNLIFPLKNKTQVDKANNIDIECIEAIFTFIIDQLNIRNEIRSYQVLVITPQKLNEKINVQLLNSLLMNEQKYGFSAVTILSQSLLPLYMYNSLTGVVVNLGEKIDIIPMSNGIVFHAGISNLAYGGTLMSDYLNSFITRGHMSYVNDMEQYLVRYVKENACYASLDFDNEIETFTDQIAESNKKYEIDLRGQEEMAQFGKVEIPQTARFQTVEGLFNPEIWGIDGVGIHKLINRAIQSSSMDLRREMARSIYLSGGMSRIPGLKERLEKEMKKLLPAALTVKVNCSDYSYHCAYLGAFRLVQQPEYNKLIITRSEWAKDGVNCLKKWRMM